MIQLTAGGVGAFSASGWLEPLAAHAATQPKQRHKSCILLWMDGGPSHHDTFDMKPDAPENIRGEYKPIASSVPGLQITEKFPEISKLMHHACVLRGMATAESEHGRARQLLHAGYRQGTGGLQYPTMGSLMTAELPPSEMPNFVVTGMHLNPANWSYVASPGYLGPRHAPLIVNDPNAGVLNLKANGTEEETRDRLSVLQTITEGFLRDRPSATAAAHKTTYQRAVELMRSEKAKAFDLTQESASIRERYGDFAFGQGCLLARRLVEVGVPFIEVYHSPTAGGWDNHSEQRTKEVRTLTMPQCDRGVSALLADLDQRGLLKDTLVVWMGEFGRTPQVNKSGGRDHYGRAWSSVLFGGGVRGGAVIGRTDKNGGTVEERPISAADFMATICTILGIDPHKQFILGERPVRKIDKGGHALTEVLA
jgi:uncharacterized protein (DUF1501 family)